MGSVPTNRAAGASPQLKAKHCLICGAAGEKIRMLYPQNFKYEELTPEIFSARRETEHFHYTVVRCENCGLVFSQSILPDDALARFYAKSKVTFQEYADIIRRDYWHLLEPFLKGNPRRTALEIGCSSGFFLETLKEKGFEQVYGCEPSREACEKAPAEIRENITADFFRPGLYPADSFDLICSFQTLDHVSDPLQVLEEARRLLKKGGLLYLIVHDAQSLQARLLGEKSPIIDIEHVYLFNRKALTRLFQMKDFEVIGLQSVKNSYPLRYWLKMFPFPSALKGLLLGVADFLGLGACPLPLKAGNLGIVGKRL